ncbi:phosphoglucomutase/phosphomannomutase family protein [Candidatus Amarolinea dominans]|uniref:phosphoglucomutase/phosphomannomutase family protein n=1 Tax=Candidatus Amarolinea dominans TaxID=3140696 RepID=UPI0031CCBED3
MAEVLAGNDIPALLRRWHSTPTIAYAVKLRHGIGAVNITASHNPPTDNGYKVRDPNGGAIDPAGLKEIEAHIPAEASSCRQMAFKAGVNAGLIMEFDPVPAYVEQLKRLVSLEPIRQAGFKIMVDPMWGQRRRLADAPAQRRQDRGLRSTQRAQPDLPGDVAAEPIPPNVDAGWRGRKIGADVIAITDGDADRCGWGDENGDFVDQLSAHALLAMYLLDVRGERGPIVKTLSTTSMLDKLGQRFGVQVIHTGVGFKYVAPAADQIRCADWRRGERRLRLPQSRAGARRHPEQPVSARPDGAHGLRPTQLLDRLFNLVGGPHYYDRIDFRLPDLAFAAAARKGLDTAQPASVGGKKIVDKVTTDGYKFVMEDGGWLLIRFSGTEPLIASLLRPWIKARCRPSCRMGCAWPV